MKYCDRFWRNQLFRSWVDDLFLERRRTWESPNNYLLREEWSGLTEKAVHRKVPSCLEDASYFREPDLFDFRETSQSDANIRIISARKATKAEIKQYQESEI